MLTSLLAQQEAWVLFSLVLVPFLGTLLLVPWLITLIPADYFRQETRKPMLDRIRPHLLRYVLLLLKNLLGLLIVVTGFAMLVLPGQGLLTILIGLLLLDFPGKYRCECWLVSRKPVLHSVNWLRRKRHKPELRL